MKRGTAWWTPRPVGGKSGWQRAPPSIASPVMSTLICYDGSDSAKHALAVAHDTLGHRPVTLLHVWTPPAAVLADAFSTRSDGPSREDLEAFARSRALEIVGEGAGIGDGLGFQVEPRVDRCETTVWQTILNVADQIDAGLIVSGTHGATAVQSSVLGSVSDGVVHHSGRPILIVPTPVHAAVASHS